VRPAIAALRRELEDDRSALERRLDQVVQRDALAGDDADLAFTALALQHACSALESVIERTVRFFDDGLPSGPDWHRALLARGALDIPGVRPAILSKESLIGARALLAFRHFLHHDYGADLDAPRMGEMQSLVARWRPAIEADLDRLDHWLSEAAGQ
jgi:hypothetical protein